VGELTLSQMNVYLSMIPYVNEWSEKFGKPPDAQAEQLEEEQLEIEAIMHGIERPNARFS
jgi:hypothetical protein